MTTPSTKPEARTMKKLKWKDFDTKSEASHYQVYQQEDKKWRCLVDSGEQRAGVDLWRHVAVTASRMKAKKACQTHKDQSDAALCALETP